MEKLGKKVFARPYFYEESRSGMEKEAKEQILKIMPPILSDLPREILASIELFPFDLREMWKRNDAVIINGKEFGEEFLPITVLEGPYDFDFFYSSSSLVCSLNISIKFKIEPFEVSYPVGVYPRDMKVVYDSIKLFYRAIPGQVTPGSYAFCFSEASYPESWQVCNGCFKPYDINELDFSGEIYLGGHSYTRGTLEEKKEFFMRHFGSGAYAKCPHCGQHNRRFDDNHFRTLKEYNEFWKKS